MMRLLLAFVIGVPLTLSAPAQAQTPEDGHKLAAEVSQLSQQGRYSEAIPIAKQLLAVAEKALGPDDPRVAVALGILAGLYLDNGHYSDAEPLYKRSLAIDEKALGPNHTHVATDLNDLAGLYVEESRYGEAEPLFQRSLDIDEKALGPDNLTVASELGNLGSLFHDQGRYRDSAPLLKRALASKEKALGPDDPHVATALNDLAELYRDEGRFSDAEPLYKRALAIDEKALGPNHPELATELSNLSLVFQYEGRFQDAEPLCLRALSIRETNLGPSHPLVAQSLSSLAVVYRYEGRPSDAEALYKRALTIAEKALGPYHFGVATVLNNEAEFYLGEARYADAEQLYKRSLAIFEKTVGPSHPDVAIEYSNLARLALAQSDWTQAADYWRQATNILERRFTREQVLSSASTDTAKSEVQRYNRYFKVLVQATDRSALEGQIDRVARVAEMFETAQWAQSSEAAASLAQMAARGGSDKPGLAAIIRERQDLVSEWQTKDKILLASETSPPEKRDSNAENFLSNRLAAIDSRISEIDGHLAKDFPDYAALASPKPLSVTDIQALLRDDEALVLFLDVDSSLPPLGEATFAWVVTKTEVRWVRSDIGTKGLQDRVAALRCGLDTSNWRDPTNWPAETDEQKQRRDGQVARRDQCKSLTGADVTSEGVPPFDIARARDLYQTLFGQVEDLIKDKQLLIVPSGSLTQLPFQVLVSRFPNSGAYGDRVQEVGGLGAELQNLSIDGRHSLHLPDELGVGVVRLVPKEAADKAGFALNDVVLSIDGVEVSSSQQAASVIRSHSKGSRVNFQILRAGVKLNITATLGGTTVTDWVPRLLAPGEGNGIHWLIADHALTVLPSVSSLKALRQYAKTSNADRSWIGFANPLLEGGDDVSVQEARAKQSCPKASSQQVVALSGVGRGFEPVKVSGVADASIIRAAPALPETADEVCAVAKDLNADNDAVYLGAKATETEVKRLSASGELARYKIVHFATHGALAGEASLSNEPGLILTPPDATSETDDGYLSASEVAALKLDADWVILSACNTAAGDASSADAMSGLARAFFYAGARALLVSHWAVNSEATVKLITGAVGRMSADKHLGRAEAMRQSMLALINSGVVHPSYWAPFVVVGEGAAPLHPM